MNNWTILKGLLIQEETDRSKEVLLDVSSSSTTGTRTTLRSAQTANRTLLLPDASDTLVGKETTDVLKNKTMDFSSTGTNTLVADASSVKFNNLVSGLSATNVQTAINEVEGRVDTAESSITSINSTLATKADQSALNTTNATVATKADQSTVTSLSNTVTSHISASSGAHAASAISVSASGNLSSTNVQAALLELQNDIDTLAPGGGANTALSNLTGTAINSSLIPSANGRTLGSSNTNQRWNEIHLQQTLAQAEVILWQGNILQSMQLWSARNPVNTPSSIGTGAAMVGWYDISVLTEPTSFNTNSGQIVLETGNYSGTNAGVSSGAVTIRSGNASAGGASGNINIRTGTTTTGTRGTITLRNGSEGTAGHVWTSTDVNGSGSWQAPVTVGIARVSGAFLSNNTSNSDQIVNMSAASVSLRNSSNQIVVRNNTGTLTNNPATSGPVANGRDQASAFTNSSWVHFYFIWNGTTLATLSSAALPSVGPTLPSGYTHFAYVGSIYRDNVGSLRITTQSGSLAYYDSMQSVLNTTSAALLSTSVTAAVPPTAISYNISYTGGATSNSSGAIDTTLSFYSPSYPSTPALPGGVLHAERKSLTGLGTSAAQTMFGGTLTMPYFDGNLRTGISFVVGFGSSPTYQVYVQGYRVANGDN